jgi:hypothetical protein
VSERAQKVRPATRSAILLGIVALAVYVTYMLLVYWKGG